MSRSVFGWARRPWALITSRWLLEVERGRSVEAKFHVIVLNEGREVPEKYRKAMIDGWGPARVCIAAEQHHGNGSLRPLYNAMGALIHRKKAGLGRDMTAAALAEAGLPADLVEAADDSARYDDPLRASHRGEWLRSAPTSELRCCTFRVPAVASSRSSAR